MKYQRPGQYPGICPNCDGRNVTMGGAYRSTHPTGPYRKGYGRVARLGDPGTEDGYTESECHDCGDTWHWTKPREVSTRYAPLY